MKTIVFAGAPGAGKTTLGLALSRIIMSLGYDVYYLDEVAKRLRETIDPVTVQHYLFSAKLQNKMLSEHCKVGYTVIDTPILMYRIYATGALRCSYVDAVTHYRELDKLYLEEARLFEDPNYTVFHIQSVHPLEIDVAQYLNSPIYKAVTRVQIEDREHVYQLGTILNYLEIQAPPELIQRECEYAWEAVCCARCQ